MINRDKDKVQDQAKDLDLYIEKEVLSAIKSIDYGSVEIIIHNSKIVQIDCRKKIRFKMNEKNN